jgi:ABC-type lipoprotein release transport system permease subunit
LASTVVDGTFGLMTDAGEALTTVSSGIAINLTVTPGPETQVGLLVPRRTGRINPANPAAAFRSDTLTVAGVFQTEHAEYDTDLMILPIASARELLQYDTPAASAIYLGLDGGADVAGVVDALAGIGGGNFTVKDRAVQQETSYRIIAIEKWITFALMVFILLVASFNIISTLAMLIVEKASTIEILRSLGASRDDVVGVFNRAGWLICFVGVVGGLVVGSALCLLQQHFGFIHLNGDSEMLITDIYPVSLRVGDLLAVAAISVVVGLMTTFFTTPFTRRYLTNNNI